MTRRPHLAPSAVALQGERLSVRVERVCEIFDCEPSQVYRLIDAGDLEAHSFGKRGVRVYLDSVAAYRERNAKHPRVKGGKRRPTERPAPTPASKAAHNAAMASLREAGVL
jgi:excisionase family DNA binding protein